MDYFAVLDASVKETSLCIRMMRDSQQAAMQDTVLSRSTRLVPLDLPSTWQDHDYAIGQRDQWTDTGNPHQTPARVIVPDYDDHRADFEEKREPASHLEIAERSQRYEEGRSLFYICF